MLAPTNRRREADEQRGAGAVDQARQHVAAELIGAEPVLETRRLAQPVERIGDRIVGCDDVGKYRHDDHDEDDDCAGRAQRIAARELPDRGQPASRLRAIRGLQFNSAVGGDRHLRPLVLPHLNRIRGSSHAYMMSTTKLVRMKIATTSMTSACVMV